MFFDFAELRIFSYGDNNQINLYDTNGVLQWDNNSTPMNVGSHRSISHPGLTRNNVYRITGDEKFTVSTGSDYTVSGYYALDPNDRGRILFLT